MFGLCDKLTTTVEAAMSSLPSTCTFFVTKDRRGVLTSEHLGPLGEGFAIMCADFGAELVEMDGEDDHVHLLVTYPPHVAVVRLMNSLKGVSARRLRQRYPLAHPPGAPVVAVVLRRLGC